MALCDAGVGLGKTYAYLVACVLWQLQRPRQMQRPVVISTASITLQNAILEEYIPFLSNTLIQNGYIREPICAVLRKGKERFVCDMRLLIRQKQITARGKRYRKRAAALREAGRCLDLDRLPNLPLHERRLICVPNRCGRSCIEHSDCRYYNRFLGWSMEFGLATIERKRIIISQLYKRIELGRGYVAYAAPKVQLDRG